MADKVTASTEFKFDEKAFIAKLNQLNAAAKAVEGKPNYNPFVWLANNVTPLNAEYVKGTRTKELFDKLMAVKAEVPPVNPKIVPPVDKTE